MILMARKICIALKLHAKLTFAKTQQFTMPEKLGQYNISGNIVFLIKIVPTCVLNSKGLKWRYQEFHLALWDLFIS